MAIVRGAFFSLRVFFGNKNGSEKSNFKYSLKETHIKSADFINVFIIHKNLKKDIFKSHRPHHNRKYLDIFKAFFIFNDLNNSGK